MRLDWTPTGGGEQQAQSDLAHEAYYVLRQQVGGWVADLVTRDDEKGSDRQPRVGRYPTEAEAKAAAAKYEDETHAEGDGCAIYARSYHPVTCGDGEVSVTDLVVGDVFTERCHEPALVRVVAAGIDGDVHLDLGSPDEDNES